jgi:16S rRNA (cytidine1402-2'-O)-methyltransferase
MLVATPIGNLRDVTLRALDALAEADIVACEDTRVTARLMARHGIRRPLIAYHEHNRRRLEGPLVRRMASGERVALVSDAGMPLLSDPGEGLVKAALAAGIEVTVLPGPSAPLAALALSGLPAEPFLFLGFAPAKPGDRRRFLAPFAQVPATLLLFEAPHRLAEGLADMADLFGARPAAVARELTKLHEEVRRGRLDELARHYAHGPRPKGEIVVVIGPPEAGRAAVPDLDGVLAAALARSSLRDAVAEAAAVTGLPRREVYARALALAERSK